MGVKNNAFFSLSSTPRSQGLDPFAPDLTIEEMAAVAVEIQEQSLVLHAGVAQYPVIGGGGSTPFDQANRGNVALFWCFFNHVMTFLMRFVRRVSRWLH